MKTSMFNPAFRHRADNRWRKFSSLFNLIIYLAIFSLTLSGCSKKNSRNDSETSNGYYYKATLDGKKTDFLTVKFQGGGNDGRWEQVVIGGYESSLTHSNGKTPPALDFEIWQLGGNIGPGTYSTLTVPVMISRYVIQTDDGLVGYNTINGKDVFTVKIEAISKSGIKGTFEGTLRNKAGEALSITDGSFNLPYDQLLNP